MKKIECACNFLMDKDAQGYIDLSDLDLTSCHFKGDVISKVSFLSSNLQHVTFECKEIGDCNFTTAIVDNVIFRCRRLHNVIFIKASGECVDFSKNILDTVDFSQSQLGHSNFANVRLEIQTSIIVIFTLRTSPEQSFCLPKKYHLLNRI
ncbi:hypothetical protein A1UY_00274 [Escherichia coli KTE81]|nr:hypothetical protein HMPREF9543_01652 [Escherichia coli MS 146-1]ELE75580.1 hypothetical protein A1UY_00274 [Escherichia coli KTE81]